MATSDPALVEILGNISRNRLDPQRGCAFLDHVVAGGYDESKLEFLTLEGTASIISHALVEITRRAFVPLSYISIYFYTRSRDIVSDSKYVKYSEDPTADSNRDYGEDRNALIQNHVLRDSILLIDGPLVGGNLTASTLKLIEHLHTINVVPIFFVKNSASNLLIKSIDSIKGKYNSDLHWSYRFLKAGERSNFFKYTDPVNPRNTKIFCYIKPFDRTSPQRVELHPETFALYEDNVDEIFDLIFYLMLVQGDRTNPQIRPIAIAENYAREIIKSVNTRTLLRNTSLIPTIDQERFGG